MIACDPTAGEDRLGSLSFYFVFGMRMGMGVGLCLCNAGGCVLMICIYRSVAWYVLYPYISNIVDTHISQLKASPRAPAIFPHPHSQE